MKGALDKCGFEWIHRMDLITYIMSSIPGILSLLFWGGSDVFLSFW